MKDFFQFIVDGDLKNVKDRIEKKQFGPDAFNEEGMTALGFAVKNGKKEIVEFLIEKKADIDRKDWRFGWTPLMIATINKDIGMVTLLLENKASPDVISNSGKTALDIGEAEEDEAKNDEDRKLYAEINNKLSGGKSTKAVIHVKLEKQNPAKDKPKSIISGGKKILQNLLQSNTTSPSVKDFKTKS